ncbi:hypothetical protein LCGC14_2204610 [marine sediment metagenome]|uniref:Uncharacterized protein n=1 Tax=marine sediment metagenome TaxID=412755 RepID=A0A0F9DFW6_9ZZZZ
MEKKKSERERSMKVKIFVQAPNYILYYVGYRNPFRDSKLIFVGIEFCELVNRLTIQKNVFTNTHIKIDSIHFDVAEEGDWK